MYKKGTDIPVADALSHVTHMDPEDNIQLPIIAVNMITTQILMSVESQGSFSGLITCGNRIIVPKEMRTEMFQYIHKGHQG